MEMKLFDSSVQHNFNVTLSTLGMKGRTVYVGKESSLFGIIATSAIFHN